MKSLDCRRLALSICIAAAMLTACGGSQPPIGAPGAMPQSRAIATDVARGGSWMVPEATSEDLLYVSTAKGPVNIYAYRSAIHKQVGTLSGLSFPMGQCVDAQGNIWITDFRSDDIVEFAHGGTSPLKTLQTSASVGPVGCSVSPNGDLAVSFSRLADGSTAGGILVFKNASGAPIEYANPKCDNPLSPGYDLVGNLYVEGAKYVSSSAAQINVCELPNGGTSLRQISFNHRLHTSGSTMWDGKHITLTESQTRYDGQTISEIFQARATRSGNLAESGVTALKYAGCLSAGNQFFIVGRKNTPVNDRVGTAAVNAPGSNYCNQVFAWSYPDGALEWSLSVSDPTGVAVSLALK